MGMVTLTLHVSGMHCGGCERSIEKATGALAGVSSVKADHAAGTVLIQFDEGVVRRSALEAIIRNAGYEPQPETKQLQNVLPRFLLFLLLLIMIGGIAFWGRSQMPGVMQQMNAELSYAVLFGIGFLTGFHCIGMCGSFIVSYSTGTTSNSQAALLHFSYGAGKTISYTVLGAGFGLLGTAFTITPVMRGTAGILAGLFLLLFGLKMLKLIPAFSLLNWRMPRFLEDRLHAQINLRQNPLLIGLLSGLLLGCGPLQAMYVLAAGTGSPGEGALLLFFFGLGTLPPLLGFGFFASFMSRKAISQLISVSGVLVIMMGLMMLNRGLLMTGSGLDFGSLTGVPGLR